VKGRSTIYVEDPPIARALFSDVRFAWIWLIVRLWLAYEWIEAGLHKVTDPAWMQTGEGLKGFLTRAVAIPTAAGARPPITYDWYRDFLNGIIGSGSYVWMAKLVAVGEVLVGVGLLVGAFVGIAAFFGAFMNMNFMLAGTASTNPVLFAVAVLLIMAWKTAGYWGLDRWLLPALGTPWHRGSVFEKNEGVENVGHPVGQPVKTPEV
jgi:thiosulfate dehydrogenase [quinone] large subunit